MKYYYMEHPDYDTLEVPEEDVREFLELGWALTEGPNGRTSFFGEEL